MVIQTTDRSANSRTSSPFQGPAFQTLEYKIDPLAPPEAGVQTLEYRHGPTTGPATIDLVYRNSVPLEDNPFQSAKRPTGDFQPVANPRREENQELSLYNLFLMTRDTAGLNEQSNMTGLELFKAISAFVNATPELRDIKLKIGNEQVKLGDYLSDFANRAPQASREETQEYFSRGRLPSDSDIRFTGGSPLLHASLSRFRETSDFGGRNTGIRGASTFHKGIDLATPSGTDLRAGTDAEVAYVGRGIRGYGNVAILNHGDGVYTLYGHLSDINARRGDRVSAGEKFADTGATGVGSGAHLHFEVIVSQNGRLYNIDPELVLSGRVNLSTEQGRERAIDMTANQSGVQEARLTSRFANQVIPSLTLDA